MAQIEVKPLVAQMAAQDKAARTGFIGQAQFNAGLREFINELVHGMEGAPGDAVTAELGGM